MICVNDDPLPLTTHSGLMGAIDFVYRIGMHGGLKVRLGPMLVCCMMRRAVESSTALFASPIVEVRWLWMGITETNASLVQNVKDRSWGLLLGVFG